MKNLASFAMSSLFVSLVGCGDNLPSSEQDPSQQDPSQDPADQPDAPKFPASCLEAGNGKVVSDGTYTLYFQGDEHKPWQAYCHQGDEFLAVEANNYGDAVTGGLATGTDIRTEYSRLRIDPETLTIDIMDATFAVTTGGPLFIGTTEVTKVPLGVAVACNGSNSVATSGVNVTETPFQIKTQFVASGVAANGHVGMFRDGRWLETFIEGQCGFTGPAAVPGAPLNLADGWLLQLVYAGPEA